MSSTYSKNKNKQHQEKPKVEYYEYLDHPSEPRDDVIYGIVPSHEVALMDSVASMRQRLRYIVRRKRNK